MEKQRPKCVASLECDGEINCQQCDFESNDACSCYHSFTPAEKVAALMDKAKELPKEIVVPALRAALEELTGDIVQLVPNCSSCRMDNTCVKGDICNYSPKPKEVGR